MKPIYFIGALFLTGCATTPTSWSRVDHKPIAADQMAADETVCHGEMQKARLAMTQESGFGRGQMLVDVYRGCMAQRGYLAADS